MTSNTRAEREVEQIDLISSFVTYFCPLMSTLIQADIPSLFEIQSVDESIALSQPYMVCISDEAVQVRLKIFKGLAVNIYTLTFVKR